MAGFLDKVREVKLSEIRKDRDYIRTLERLVEERGNRVFDFLSGLRSCRTKIIAEVKKASPSAGHIRDVEPHKQAQLYEKAGAVAISVLTDKTFFNGSLEDLRQVRSKVNLPILRKDFILDRVQILEAKAFGADAVLLIVKMLDRGKLKELYEFAVELGLTPLIEVFSLEEAKLSLDMGAELIGVNNRDLQTLRVDINLSKELIPRIKEEGARFVVAESGIETREHIIELMNLGADAFLVGTALMKSPDPYRKLKELLGIVSHTGS
jgi:indole-3-glycerol phosphate synthase